MSGTETGGDRLVDVTMPRLSDSMESATILRWLRRPGDQVVKGEPLVEVETDKATIVYEAELDGLLAEIVVDDDGTAELGEVIARVTAGAAAPASSGARAGAPPQRRERTSPRRRATPVARRLAGELGIALDGLSGSGPGGRIVRADVRGAARSGAPTAPSRATGRGEEVEIRLTATQRTIAERMARSRAEIPEFTVEAEIDMEAAAALRAELRGLGHLPPPSFNDLIVRAVALALRDVPALNAAFVDGRVVRFSRVNVGVAVATEDALVVPTIFDADRKSLLEIAAEARMLAERVRNKTVGVDELHDGTITVSNLGMFGVRRFNAVINPPQAAIVAVGEVDRRAVVDASGGIVARARMDVSLSCDHRVVYGAEAAQFLQRLKALLEQPAALAND